MWPSIVPFSCVASACGWVVHVRVDRHLAPMMVAVERSIAQSLVMGRAANVEQKKQFRKVKFSGRFDLESGSSRNVKADDRCSTCRRCSSHLLLEQHKHAFKSMSVHGRFDTSFAWTGMYAAGLAGTQSRKSQEYWHAKGEAKRRHEGHRQLLAWQTVPVHATKAVRIEFVLQTVVMEA